MSEYRNKEYIESMSHIKLSDDKKEKMISDLTKISPIRKEGTMKKNWSKENGDNSCCMHTGIWGDSSYWNCDRRS